MNFKLLRFCVNTCANRRLIHLVISPVISPVIFAIGTSELFCYAQTAAPDINNIGQACNRENRNDPICQALKDAMTNAKAFEEKQLDYFLKRVHLGPYEYYAATGLSILINRKIELKSKFIFSDNIDQKIEINQDQAIFSLEFNF